MELIFHLLRRPIIAALAIVLLAGCEDKSAQKTVSDSQQQQTAQTSEGESNASADAQTENRRDASAEGLETGQYLLQVFDGKVSLYSAGASRITILEDMATTIGFALEYSDDSDKFVVVNLASGSIPDLLNILLEGVDYTVAYQAQADDNGFTISRLSLRPLAANSALDNSAAQPQLALEPQSVDALSTKDILLGNNPGDEELAARLQYGSEQEKIDAIDELILDPAGLNAAYQVFTRASSPQLRIAVLELVESEDEFLARLLTVASLRSTDPGEVLYALSVAESLDDYSLASRIEALTVHPDAAVRQAAIDVLQSITGDYDEYQESEAFPGVVDPGGGGRHDGGVAGDP